MSAEQSLIYTAGRRGPGQGRLHRATCKKAHGHATALKHLPVNAIQAAQAATCCKPHAEDVEAAKAEARARNGQTEPVPALTEAEDGVGELAGGDVQPLPRPKSRKVRTPNRHDQRDVKTAEEEARERFGFSNLEAPEVYAGPVARVAPDGLVMPATATSYPEVMEGDLWCHTGGHLAKASAFPFVTKKGSGKGRLLECAKHWHERLEENKARRAVGKDPIKAPRAEVPK